VDHFDEIKGTRQEGKGTRQEGKGTRQEGKGTRGGPDSLINPLKNPFTNPLTPAAPASPASLSESDNNPSTASFFEKEESEAKEGKEEQQERAPQGSAPPPRENATVVPPPDKAADCAVPKRRRSKDKPPVDDASFETWWAEYPKKVDPGAARKAYAAARKKASGEELLDGVKRYVEALNARAAQEGRDKPDPQFIKNPSGWLSGERWLDQPVGGRVIDQDGRPDMTYRANGHSRSKVDEAIARNLENCRRMGII
jgi:hypothetical protein